MQEHYKLDENFRDKLREYDSGVPEHLWQKIEARRRPKRRLWLFFLFAGLMFGGALGYAYWSNSADKTIPSNTSAQARLDEGKPDLAGANPVVENMNRTSEPTALAKIPTVTNNKSRLPAVFPASYRHSNPIASTIPNTSGEAKTAPVQTELLQSEQSEVIFAKSAVPNSLPGLKNFLLSQKDRSFQLADPEGCPSFTPRLLSSFYVDVMGGPGFAFRKLTDLNETEFGSYSELRDSTERSWYAFGAGARASIVWRSGLAARAGVNYSQINEIFEYENEREVRTTIKEIFDSNGNLLRRDTIFETGRRVLTTYNRFRFWDIPVMLGYEMERQKSTLSFNAGVSLNISSTQKGTIIDPDTSTPVLFTTGRDRAKQLFETKAGLSVIGSVAYSHEIAENLHWTVEPTVRYFTKSVAYQQPLEQKYWTVSLYTGLRYYFN